MKNSGGVVLHQAEHGKAALEYLLGSEKCNGKPKDGVPTPAHYVDCLVWNSRDICFKSSNLLMLLNLL